MKNKKVKAVIFDIDGVILDSSAIWQQVEKKGLTGDAVWDYFDKHANSEVVTTNTKMIKLIENFHILGYKIIILTARSESIRKHTMFRLNLDFYNNSEYKIEYELYMRQEDDTSTSYEVKQNHLENILKFHNVFCAYDDDDSNCKMFSENGILTFKVCEGDIKSFNS